MMVVRVEAMASLRCLWMPAGNPVLLFLSPFASRREENRFDSHAHLESEYTQTRDGKGGPYYVSTYLISTVRSYMRLHV